MKRAKTGLAVATLIAAAFGMLSAGASPVPSATNCGSPYDTVAPHLYKYCGDHWAKYPVHYAVVTTGLPSGVTSSQFTAAVEAAAGAWNMAWPNQMPAGNCAQQVVLCHDQTSPNKVSWAQIGGNPAPLAQTTTYPAHGIISSGAIVLNSQKIWKIVKNTDYQALALGEAIGAGVPDSVCPAVSGGCDYYDVQDVLTHEFGHLLGLGHPGFSTGEFCFPSELRDPADYQQTMYACTPKGDTSKRTLAEGDILGLAQIFNDSL